ncbi:NUDIX domain-containing protein [Candidatus Nomurabacteria bacterium]|nr:NUDIX domain-containing protein [Candidatus Nomurabacteria bacterium]
MEMIDILNEDGTLTGNQASKTEIHEKGFWHRAAHMWFVNDKDKILLQKRSKNVTSHPGKYDISAAGHLSAGDLPLQGALREVEEELGIKLSENDLVKIGEVRTNSTQYNGKYINKEINDIYLVFTKLREEDFTIQVEELELITYIPISEFKEWVNSGREDLVMHPDEFKILFQYLDAHQIL